MANKPFEIQSSTLTIGGVDLQAGNTGVVIPGVTQATDYKVEEVDDTGDQTYQFAPNDSIVVIDKALYDTIVSQGNESTFADFTAPTDDDGYIDEIEVNGQGTYSAANADRAANNDMYAYIGTGSASDRPLVPQDWIQIPFRPRMRAGEVENIGGGGGGANNISELNDVEISDPQNGQAIVWDENSEAWRNQTISGNTDTGDITFSGDEIGSTTDVVNINANEYAQLQSNNSYVWVEENGAHIEVGDGEGLSEFTFEYNSGSSRLKLPVGGDIVDSTGNSVLGVSGNINQLTNPTSGDTLAVMDTGDVILDGEGPGGVDRGLVWKFGENNDGVNSMVRQDEGGLTVRAWTENGGSTEGYSAPVKIVTNQDAAEKIWEFDGDGVLTFPDGSTQSTAYIGQEISPSVPRSDTAPVADNGQLWFNTLEGRMYIKYDDVWVDAAPLMTPAPEVDIDVATITFPDSTVQTTAFTGFNNTLVNGNYEVALDQDGALNLPNRGVIRNLSGTHDVNLVATGSSGYAQLQWTTEAGAAEANPNGTDEPLNWVYVEEPGVFIETNVNGPTGDSQQWEFNKDGNLIFPNQLIINSESSNNSMKLGGNNSFITIYDIGAPPGVYITADGTVGYGNTWSFTPDGNITLPTNTSAINYSNGTSILDGLGGGSSYGNSNVTSYLPTHTGNVSANYFLGNVAGGNVSITGQLNVSGTVTSNFIPQSNITHSLGNSTHRWKDIYLASSTVYLGNVELSEGAGNSLSVVGNISTTGTLYTSGLVSTSMLSATGGLSVTGGNILTSGGIYADFDISTAGNVTGNYFLGNGSQLTGITATNATTAGTVTTNAQPNITSVGTLTSLTVGPNSSIVLSGTAGYLKANSLQGHDGSQTLYLYYNDVMGAVGVATDLTVGTAGGNLKVPSGYMSASGNVTGNYFIGNGSTLTNITGANVSGTVASATSATSATTAATVTTAAQPNVTSVGTLASLSVSGNITSGNLLTGGVLSATGTITGGNVTTGGQVSATGNVTGANLVTAGLLTVTGNVIGGNITTANTISATGNIRSNSSFIATNVAGTITIGNTNSYMMGIGNVDGYVQSYVYNKSNTADASADMIVYGSAGTDNSGYMDMGMTSNNFSSSFFTVTGKSEGYLFMSGVTGTSGNMVLATGPDGTYNSIEFYVGGFNSAKGANRPLLLTKALTTVTGNLSVTGNVTSGNLLTGGLLSATGNITSAGTFVGNGAGLTNVTVSAAGNIVGTSSNVTLVAGSYSWTFDNTGNSTFANGVASVVGTATTGVSAAKFGASATFLPNTVASFTSNVNNYTQVTLQNLNTGTDATSDIVITADNGNDTVNYSDFGIINSGYDNATPTNSLGNIVFAGDTYLYAQGNVSNTSQSGGNLAIGTTIAGKTVKIFAGGVTSSNIVATISNTGVSVTGNVTVSGTSGVITPNLPAFRVYGSGSTTITVGTTLTSTHFTLDYQQGGTNLVVASGIFTAPVAGLYQINLVARAYSNAGIASQIAVVKNPSGSALVMCMIEWAANTTVNHMGASTVAKLAAGDTLVVKVLLGSAQFDANDSWSVTFLG